MKSLAKVIGVLSILAGIYTVCHAVGLTTANSDIVDYCTGANNSNCVFRIDSVGNVTSLGTLNSSSTSGTSTFTNDVSIAGNTVFAPTTASVSSTTILNPTATFERVVSTGGAVTIIGISTASIADGTYLILGSTSDVSVVVVTSGTSSGTGVGLGAATRTLDSKGKLVLIFDLFGSIWREVSYAAN